MKLLVPVTYRLKAAQDAWLRTVANNAGHGNKAISLRMIIDEHMTRTLKQNGQKSKHT